MFRNIFMWILRNIFKVSTETNTRELEDNQKYAFDYERIDEINFNAIFSNKLASYVVSDSTMNIDGDNDRTELLNKIGQSLWKKSKKYVSMSFGYGGVFLVPYVKGNKLFYNVVPQGRVTIDSVEGENITGATILAEKKVIKTNNGRDKIYIRWTNYKIENNKCIIEQKFSDENGDEIPVPIFWNNIMLKQVITDVDRVLFGFIKSPINNRKVNDKYGVPITYGCEHTIKEIKATMKQLYDEYKLKRPFVGADITMFNGNNELAEDGLFKKIDTGVDSFFEVFDPQFRDYTIRLQELYKRLEHEVGTSYGILSEVQTQNATATEIKKSMYDTFVICDDMRTNIEKGLDDFFYACNVLANAYNLSSQGDYKVNFDWSYSLLEDTQAEWNQMIYGHNIGIVSKAELRQWLRPDEELEESEKVIKEIEAEEPSTEELLKKENENNKDEENTKKEIDKKKIEK